jgi:tRNA 2-thiouridine synthesizing protein A
MTEMVLEKVVTEKVLDLRGLKCPLPVLRTRKALAGLRPGDVLTVACTDPLAGIDIPNLLQQTGDALEGTEHDARVMSFRIRKS